MDLQMTWQAYRRKRAPLGLENRGNTCYLNSVLQCLTYTPPFANFCLGNQHSSSCTYNNFNKSPSCPFCLVEERIVRSLSIECALDRPLKIVSSIQIFAKQFRQGRQEDAHEFLRFVIDACNDVCVKMYKAQKNLGGKQLKQEPHTIIKEIFGGVLQSQIKCLCCRAESNKMDEILDISLDIMQVGSLKDSLGRFFEAEVLDGSNKYHCEKCNKLSTAHKQLFICQAPNVLVIQLKRFEDGFGVKIDRNITFEEHLGLAEHMSRSSQDPQPEYTLFGTIVHSGYSQDSGHYYAYVKDANSRWYCCNDVHVSPATIKDVLAEKVYILFFVRSSPIPKRGKELISSNVTDCTNSVANGGYVSFKQRPSGLSNASAGVLPCRGNPDNGLAKLHPKPQLKIAHLKKAGSQIGKSRTVENGNGTSNPDVALRDGDSENSIRKTSEKSDLDASLCNSSSISRKDELLKHRESSDVHCESSNGKLSSSLYKASKCCSETNGQSCRNVSINGNILTSNSVGGMMPGSNGYIPMDRLQNTKNNTSCNGKNELRGSDSRNHGGEYTQSSLPEGIENSSEERVLKRRREEHENMHTGNGHTEHADFVLKRNVGSPMKSQPNGAETVSELDKLKEMLCKEAREKLWSSGWCDNVRNSMRERKGICIDGVMQARKRKSIDGVHLSGSDTDIRDLLKSSVRDFFIREVPNSLKGHLLNQLISYFKGNS